MSRLESKGIQKLSEIWVLCLADIKPFCEVKPKHWLVGGAVVLPAHLYQMAALYPFIFPAVIHIARLATLFHLLYHSSVVVVGCMKGHAFLSTSLAEITWHIVDVWLKCMLTPNLVGKTEKKLQNKVWKKDVFDCASVKKKGQELGVMER